MDSKTASTFISDNMRHLERAWMVLICIVIIVLLATSADIRRYWDHQQIQRGSVVTGEQDFLLQAEVKKSPLPETWLLEMIDQSAERVWVAVYTFTLPGIRESLLKAQQRGVDVRVILEKSPYGNASINRETRMYLQTHTIPLHESGADQFAFMHAKYAVFDDRWMIATANWTRASFSSNREFFVLGDDPMILTNLVHLFESDFTKGIGKSDDSRLLAGPANVRERLLLFAEKARNTLDIYAPSFTDSKMLTRLSELCQQGTGVRLLLADYPEMETAPTEYGNCLQVRRMKKPLHAKALIRDRSAAFVGSFNYTQNSLENNREVGLFLSGEITRGLSESFESDWKQSVALR